VRNALTWLRRSISERALPVWGGAPVVVKVKDRRSYMDVSVMLAL